SSNLSSGRSSERPCPLYCQHAFSGHPDSRCLHFSTPGGVSKGSSGAIVEGNARRVTMTTKLQAPLQRGLSLKGRQYTRAISEEGLHLAQKGRRKGHEIAWTDLISGDAALATALNASLALTSPTEPARPPKRKSTATRSRKTSRKSAATRPSRRR